MKIFHISDLHIGKQLNYYNLKENQAAVLKEIVRKMEEYHPDVLLIAGDIFDKSVPSGEAYTLFDDFLNQAAKIRPAIPICIIAGNHDSPERLNYASSFMEKHRIYISAMPPQKPEEFLKKLVLEDGYGPVNFYFLPFTKPGYVRRIFPEQDISDYEKAVRALLEREAIDWNQRNVLISHQFYQGQGWETQTCESEQVVLSVGGLDRIDISAIRKFDYAALGHLHGPQKAGANGWYSGSPLCYSFDEEKQKKGCTVVTLKGYETDCRQVPVVPMRPMRTLTAAFDQLMEEGKKSPCQDYVFLTLTDDKPVYMPVDQLREYYPNLLGLTSQWLQNGGLEGLTGEQQEKRELLKRGGEKEIFSAFLTSVCQSGATEEDQALFDRILAQVGREAEQ